MIKKLKYKKWVIYNKKEGQKLALKIIRTHRLCKFFIYKKLIYNLIVINYIKLLNN